MAEFQLISESRKKISIWFKIKSFFMYGITTWDFYKQDISKIIITIQAMYYDANAIRICHVRLPMQRSI